MQPVQSTNLAFTHQLKFHQPRHGAAIQYPIAQIQDYFRDGTLVEQINPFAHYVLTIPTIPRSKLSDTDQVKLLQKALRDLTTLYGQGLNAIAQATLKLRNGQMQEKVIKSLFTLHYSQPALPALKTIIESIGTPQLKGKGKREAFWSAFLSPPELDRSLTKLAAKKRRFITAHDLKVRPQLVNHLKGG